MANIEKFDKELFLLYRSSFNDNMSSKTNIYQSIIDVIQMQNDLISMEFFFFYIDHILFLFLSGFVSLLPSNYTTLKCVLV
jgi:hypothetical protein